MEHEEYPACTEEATAEERGGLIWRKWKLGVEERRTLGREGRETPARESSGF